MLRTIRVAIRSVLRGPGFAIPAITLLALGIGSSTALFSIVHALLLNPLPYPQSHRLYWAWATAAQQPPGAFAIEDYEELERRSRAFASLVALHQEPFDTRFGGEPERLQGMVCTASFSQVMGSPAFAGRTFLPADDSASPRAMLLSHRLWLERFGGKQEVVGTTILMNAESFLIVGVMPPEFRFPAFAQLWVSAAPRAAATPGYRSQEREAVVGRLREGVSPAQAGDDVQRVFMELQREGLVPGNFSARLVSLQERLVGGYRVTLYGLLCAAGLLLLIACAAVANLFVARALHQQPAWSLRLALGARWRHLLAPMFAEGLVISLAGGLLGLAIGTWGMRALLLVFPNSFPRAWEIGFSPSVAAFALATAVGASLLSSSMTLLRLSPKKLAESLRTGQQPVQASSAAEFFSSAIVSSQVMTGVILLTAALLLGRNLERALSVDLGMARNFFMFRLELPALQYAAPEKRAQFFHLALERITGAPGVDAVAASNDSPPGPQERFENIEIFDRPARESGDDVRAALHIVSSGFFSALQIPLREGRGFTDRDTAGSPPVVVINERMARRFWPHESALGRRIRYVSDREESWYEVVGVAANARHSGPVENYDLETYIPVLQKPPFHMVFSVRTRAEMGPVLSAIRSEVEGMNPEQFVLNVFSLDRYIETWLVSRRLNVVVMRIFGGLALALSVAGIFSLISYRVAQRRREFGVRMALGASKNDVLLHMMRQGFRLVIFGMAAGVAGVWLLSKFAARLFSEPVLPELDVVVIACLLLGATSLAACWLPARRATKVDPIVALRHEY